MYLHAYVFGLPSPFFWGFWGSMAVAIILLHESWDAGDDVPAKYKSIRFWALRFLVACVGGGLAYAYGIYDNPILAANIGASAPAILHSFKNPPPVPPHSG